MKRSELILEYIDGTLDGNAEQQLFDELARQPELRSEMRQFIVIGEAVRADREAFLPPRDLENALMAGLGLAPLPGAVISGAAPMAAPVATGLLAKLGFVKGFLPFLTAFVLGGLLVGGGVYFGMRDDTSSLAAGVSGKAPGLRPDSAIEQEKAPASAEPVESGSNRVATPPVAANAAGVVIPPTAATPSRRPDASFNRGSRRNSSFGLDTPSRINGVSNSGRGTTIPDVLPDSSPSAEPPSSPAVVDESRLREGSAMDRLSLDSALRDGNLSPAPVPPIVLPREEEAPQPSTVTAEVRSIATILHNDNRAKLPANRMFEAGAIGFQYRVGDSYQFGVEVGRERFHQTFHYSTVVGDGKRVVRIDQAPSLYWGGVSGRINSAPLFLDGMTSFLQLTVGAAPSYGPMMRARAGVHFDLGSPFGLPLALAGSAEGATLLYFRGSESMASTNGGISLGFEVGAW